ncbi:MAG: hypothetical protein A7316_00540 [Candidatus Altiarchaeales archaeon WOR_SM1_86-2]|nr:MAG: hypothetical protein A7316_00540 [Candidatus Altiarchaeales archaeon WOR_SM1_86-2]ODS41763.1 MAG: hypothetical protein A7315_00170 [Candidatus Altiarchaeales archaeon WOR_SM1_79]
MIFFHFSLKNLNRRYNRDRVSTAPTAMPFIKKPVALRIGVAFPASHSLYVPIWKDPSGVGDRRTKNNNHSIFPLILFDTFVYLAHVKLRMSVNDSLK